MAIAIGSSLDQLDQDTTEVLGMDEVDARSPSSGFRRIIEQRDALRPQSIGCAGKIGDLISHMMEPGTPGGDEPTNG